MASNYTRGEMDISGHKKTFAGFMGTSVYGGAAIILSLLYPILVFGVHLGWLTALIVTFVVGVILGVALKFKSGWYAGMIAAAIPVAIISMILAATM